MKLLVDEDLQSKRLIAALRAAGHDVASVGELHLNGADDAAVLKLAVRLGRSVLTRNAIDFLELHEGDQGHPGILAVYGEPDPDRDMTPDQIVVAIANLAEVVTGVAGQFHVLNHWRWGTTGRPRRRGSRTK